jgi:hypothetical protein
MTKRLVFPCTVCSRRIVTLFTSFWSRVLAFASLASTGHFVKSLRVYIEAVCQEVEDRDRGRIRGIEDYLALRRGSVGLRPCFGFLLLILDLPEEVITHPRIERLAFGAIDMSILSNVSTTLNCTCTLPHFPFRRTCTLTMLSRHVAWMTTTL